MSVCCASVSNNLSRNATPLPFHPVGPNKLVHSRCPMKQTRYTDVTSVAVRRPSPPGSSSAHHHRCPTPVTKLHEVGSYLPTMWSCAPYRIAGIVSQADATPQRGHAAICRITMRYYITRWMILPTTTLLCCIPLYRHHRSGGLLSNGLP